MSRYPLAKLHPLFIHLVNLIIALLPSTRLFGVKRVLWRMCGKQISRGVSINLGCRLVGSGPILIGSEVWLGLDTTFIVPDGGSVMIGANCDVAPDVLFQCGSHEIGGPTRRAGAGYAQPIKIGDGTWIGARVVLLGGADVGCGCVIAAGAVVRGGVYPADSLLAGVPARVVKTLVGGSLDAARRN